VKVVVNGIGSTKVEGWDKAAKWTPARAALRPPAIGTDADVKPRFNWPWPS
jgi:hypothetical protein